MGDSSLLLSVKLGSPRQPLTSTRPVLYSEFDGRPRQRDSVPLRQARGEGEWSDPTLITPSRIPSAPAIGSPPQTLPRSSSETFMSPHRSSNISFRQGTTSTWATSDVQREYSGGTESSFGGISVKKHGFASDSTLPPD